MDRSFGSHRGVDLQQFIRDDKGRWLGVELHPGWYQSASGELYHYDGVIWDKVPYEDLTKLEYLG